MKAGVSLAREVHRWPHNQKRIGDGGQLPLEPQQCPTIHQGLVTQLAVHIDALAVGRDGRLVACALPKEALVKLEDLTPRRRRC